MDKLVVLRLSGSITVGFDVLLEVGSGDKRASYEAQGTLPPAPHVPGAGDTWRDLYHQTLQKNRQKTRKIKPLSVTQDGTLKNSRDRCRQQAQQFVNDFQQWLASPGFRPIEEGLRETLTPENRIRILVRSEERYIHQLPWHQWDFLSQYPHAEVAFAPITARRPVSSQGSNSKGSNTLKILAILGRDEDIDLATDQALLKQLPKADVTVLQGCDRRTFSEVLRAQPWHMLFFAGHSETVDGQTGVIYLNEHDSLSLDELRYGLQDAIAQGLQVAIFNSCDGMGLAYDLNALNIPTLIVMREPIPDPVAHLFLQYFLTQFAQGVPLFEAVRKGREQLEEGLANQFPCSGWLPIIWQNPTTVPLAWPVSGRLNQWAVHLYNRFIGNRGPQNPAVGELMPKAAKPIIAALELALVLLGSVSVSTGVMGLRYTGIFQNWEIAALDHLMSLRPPEPLDTRILIVMVTEADIRTEGSQAQQSITDTDLERLLEILFAASPRIVGLDIIRDFPVKPGHDKLVEFLGDGDRLITICAVGDQRPGYPPLDEIEPAPEADPAAIGFSDNLADADDAHRRHLLAMGKQPGDCQATWALSAHLAQSYLESEGIEFIPNEQPSFWQFGKAKFTSLKNHPGGYRKADLEGFQILLKYRLASDPEPLRAFTEIPLQEVLLENVSPDLIRDRIVLIGTDSRSIKDEIRTPYRGPNGSIHIIPGVVHQAHMTSQLIEAGLGHRDLIQIWPVVIEGAWIVSWGLVGSLIGWRWHRTGPFGLGLGSASGSLWGVSWGVLIVGSLWVPLIPAGFSLIGTSSMMKILNSIDLTRSK